MRLAQFPRVNEVLDQRMVSAGNEENSLEGCRYLSSEVCICGGPDLTEAQSVKNTLSGLAC